MSKVRVLSGSLDKYRDGSFINGTVFVNEETMMVFGPLMGERGDTLEQTCQRAYDFLDYLELDCKYEDVTTLEDHVLLSLYKEWVGR